MNHSIDLMEALAEESGNVFKMNRRGYLYLTADEKRARDLEATSQRISSLGPAHCAFTLLHYTINPPLKKGSAISQRAQIC